ncbi:MAG: cysteine--tRNA ligase [Candidatus Yanofskybacteria bacterium]|nr:cysteine--tRNA ligase [Candidatus Yanofskybacteria bacterium]
MPIHLYNSLTRNVEPLTPRTEGVIQMFVCGPTVFDFIHVGNARTFTIFDVVAKWLRYRGYEVTYLQNITDIDDKIIRRAGEQGRDPLEYAREYEQYYRDDMQALGNTAVTQYPRATDHIEQVKAQVKTLIAKGNAYLIEGDGWYYDLTTFPDYGKLSGRTGLQADDAVSRIDDAEKKRNTGDFALWKLSKPGEPTWDDAELGAGRPGWHIEDTAITQHYFGPQYDLHGGAMDLKFPHHEAEIAQQEAASGLVPFVRHWMHAGFLQIDQKRMGKSMGNMLGLREALKRWSPETLRFFLLSGHYRAPLDFSEASLDAAQAAVQRITELLTKVHALPPSQKDDSALMHIITETRRAVEDAMDNDFNTAAAFGAVFALISAANKAFTENRVGTEASAALKAFFEFLSEQFGIVPAGGAPLSADIQSLVDERQLAREQKDFATADQLRDELAKLGYTVDDTAYGPLVKEKIKS